MLAELIEGHDLYEVEDYAMAIPQNFYDFVRELHIDYNLELGEYSVKQVIME